MAFIRDGRLLIQRAFEHGYAMPAFNICSLEMAKACVDAAESERAPIIIQTYPGDLEHASPFVMANMVRALAEEATVPVMLHLDHGDSLGRTVACMRAGYSSVMFDGEAYPLDENIARTAQVVRFAHAAGASVEAAAGSFGGGEGGDDDIHLTEPELAARLMSESGADMVAVSVGSMHGQSSQLDINRLADIAAAVKKPLVLHGGTGIPAKDIAAALEHGVVKVNIGAGLQRAVLRSWKNEQPSHYAGYTAAYEALFEVATNKIRIMHASGQASS